MHTSARRTVPSITIRSRWRLGFHVRRVLHIGGVSWSAATVSAVQFGAVLAFIGVLSALMALQLERARELAVLRATGVTPGQVWRYITLQTGLEDFEVVVDLIAVEVIKYTRGAGSPFPVVYRAPIEGKTAKVWWRDPDFKTDSRNSGWNKSRIDTTTVTAAVTCGRSEW